MSVKSKAIKKALQLGMNEIEKLTTITARDGILPTLGQVAAKAKPAILGIAGAEKLSAKRLDALIEQTTKKWHGMLGTLETNPEKANIIADKAENYLRTAILPIIERESKVATTAASRLARWSARRADPGVEAYEGAYKAILTQTPEQAGKVIQESLRVTHTPGALKVADKAMARRMSDLLHPGSLTGARFFAEEAQALKAVWATARPRVQQQVRGVRGRFGSKPATPNVRTGKAAATHEEMLRAIPGLFEAQVGFDVGLVNPQTWKGSIARKMYAGATGARADVYKRTVGAMQKPGLGRRAREAASRISNRPWTDPTKGTLLAGAAFYGLPAFMSGSRAIEQAGSDMPRLRMELEREATVGQIPTVAELLLGQNIQEMLTQRAQRMGTATPSGAYIPAPQPARGVIKFGGGQPIAASGGNQDIASLLLSQMGQMGGLEGGE